MPLPENSALGNLYGLMTNLRSLRCPLLTRFALVLAFMPGLAAGAQKEQEEPGNLVVMTDPVSRLPKVRLLRKWYTVKGHSYASAVIENGTRVSIDSLTILWRMNLADFEFPELMQDDLLPAKGMVAKVAAAVELYPQLSSYLNPPLTRLRAEISRVERGERKTRGQWFTAAQWAERVAANRSTISRGTLVLKNGTRYRDVDITSATPKELRIMYSDGVAVIPMSEVPVEFQREYLKNLLPPAK